MAIITENGTLSIQRHGSSKRQRCPWIGFMVRWEDETVSNCGDWCPLFGEHNSGVTLYCTPLGQTIEISSDRRSPE